MSTTRAACYGRVSDPAEEEGESLKRQEAACRTFCQEHGYAVVAFYRDAKTGVAFRDRDGLRDLRLALSRGEFDVVVIRDLDRLTRHQAHLYMFMEECDSAGVRVEFVNERFEDTPEGRLLRSVRAYVAEVEREKIVWRTQNGRRDRVRAGRPLPGRRPPYGYRWRDAEKTRLEPVAVEAPIVRRIFVASADGHSLGQIAEALAQDGISSPDGYRHWARRTLAGLVRHPVYKGQPVAYRWGWERRRDGVGHQWRRKEEEWVSLQSDTAPAIVEPAVWDRANAVLDRRVPVAMVRRTSTNPRLLQGGFARCSGCGMALSLGSSRGFRYYECRKNDRARQTATGSPTCPLGVRVSATRLDGAAWAYIEDLLRDDRLWITLVQAARDRQEQRRHLATSEEASLDRQIAERKRRMANLSRQLGLLDDDKAAAPHLAQLKALAGEVRNAEQQRAELVARLAVDDEKVPDARRVQEMVLWRRNVLDRLSGLDDAERRDALTALGVTVRVQPARPGPGGRRKRWSMTNGLGL